MEAQNPNDKKTNALLNLINNQPDIDKIYSNAKDLCEGKYQFLINKRESTGLKNTLMIWKHLFSIQMICKIFIKILKNTTQIKNAGKASPMDVRY